MKIIAISDTHGQHRSLTLPKGDMIIHAGDFSQAGRPAEVIDFLAWFSQLKFRHKIFIAGNHDFFFESAHPDVINEMIPKGVTYLYDSGVEIAGVKIWGSPVTPWFNNWAFNRNRGNDMKKHWDLIPDDIDILVTHGPPLGILDETVYGKRTGCEELLLRIQQVKPKYHIFGHIHEDYGNFTEGGTTFINASVVDHRYDLRNLPVEINVNR
ncbi:metallophosphatase domain-containing protein [Sphingobacterium paludis]|uniref:Icc-related predicted phosphoesterase n=1 Tax=Sphingobacterium paludis TaxID=1476465 RepID=A0A4V6PZX0_9SPHI|nr:metallophosphatase domain-containing protein [Sphingobacterium paludis]TDS11738.1 Icc-related predicted phosphoesterase [Sphingobacterium paludis]